MKTSVDVEINAKVDKTVNAIEKVKNAVKDLQIAIEKLNETGIEINIRTTNKSNHWYQFWK
jgi:predicted  nucleic acid-binding Zn-ribbon protein